MTQTPSQPRPSPPNTAQQSSTPKNPCRYGYLYSLHTLGAYPLLLTEVRHRKPRSPSHQPPSLSSLADYFLYQVPRTSLERALCGKNTHLQLTEATYASSRRPDVVAFASPSPLPFLHPEWGPSLLPDYLGHLHLTDPVSGISEFLERNNHPRALALVAEAFGIPDPLPAASSDLAALIISRLPQPVPASLSSTAREFFAANVAPRLADSFSVSDVLEDEGRLELGYDAADADLALSTGVATVTVTPTSAGLSFAAHHLAGADDIAAIVLFHPRGITEVLPLAPPGSQEGSRSLLRDWAGAIPVVGPVAKAAVSTAFHFAPLPMNPLTPLRTQATFDSPAGSSVVSFTIEAPSFSDIGSAIEAADILAASAGIPTEFRSHLRARLLQSASSSTPRWRFRSHLVATVMEMAHTAELSLSLPAPLLSLRGTAHPELASKKPTPPTPAAAAPPTVGSGPQVIDLDALSSLPTDAQTPTPNPERRRPSRRPLASSPSAETMASETMASVLEAVAALIEAAADPSREPARTTSLRDLETATVSTSLVSPEESATVWPTDS